MNGKNKGRGGALDETLERLAEPAPGESEADEPVHLTEDEDTGDRFLLYATDAGVQVQLKYEGDDLLMTQPQMADLFGVTRQNVNLHLNNIYSEGELDREATSKDSLQVRQEGTRKVKRAVTLFTLDAIIAVGYRVSTKQGTLFRKWATDKLVRFATKGFVVDAARLSDPNAADHFRELRELIRDIRASEANVYKEVMRICSLCSDYHDLSGRERGLFFSAMQNKLHYAVTGMTGAEIRMARADAAKADIGLTSWTGNRITQNDVLTAKNFLGEAEIRDLNRTTGMLLDYFEQELDLGRLVLMGDAIGKVDTFIRNNERPLLAGTGSVSKVDADTHAKAQYRVWKEEQRRIAHEASAKGD